MIERNLKVEDNVLHVESWDTETFDTNSFSVFPVVIDIIEHIVSQTVSPEVDLPFGFVPLTKLNKKLPLRFSERWALYLLPLFPPFLFQLRILPSSSLHRLHLRLHRRRAHTRPLPVQSIRTERGVLGLSQPNGPHTGTALRVAEPEIEGETGVHLLHPFQRRRWSVLRLRRLLLGIFRGWRWWMVVVTV